MSAAPQKSLVGRIVVHTVWWSIALYACVALFASVGVSLYGRPPEHGSTPESLKQQRRWCLTTLTGLRDELDAQMTLELTRPDKSQEPLARFHHWESEWRAILDDATARCTADVDPELDAAYQRLRALHQAYGDGLTQITRGRITVSRAFDESVEELKRRR